MRIILLIILIILFIILFFLFVPFKLRIVFTNTLDFEVKFLWIRILKLDEKAAEKKAKTIRENYDLKVTEIGTYLKAIKDFLALLEKHVRHKLTLRDFKFHLEYGNGDAADTAIYTGGISSLVCVFFGYIHENYNLKDYSVKITPNFDTKISDLDFEVSAYINLWWVINLCVQEEKALIRINNILSKKDGVEK
ncbi:MAG: DUF2953 domain-containing protein [Clostridia bacterium]|nr:DUF2953 domain-containing protein [Clostridia bacterium]